jgi:hypothetical protein
VFRLLVVAFAVASSLLAQTAGMVVTAAANYNLRRAGIVLSYERAQAADGFAREAEAANAANQWSVALLQYARAAAAIGNVEWTPDVELAGSLWPKVNRALIDPGRGGPEADGVRVSISYPSPRASMARLQAAVYLIGPDQSETQLVPLSPVDPDRIWRASFTMPSVTGDYAIEVRFTDANGLVPAGAENLFRKSVPIHVEELADDYELLRKSLLSLTRSLPDHGRANRAVLGAREVLDHYNQARHGSADVRRYNFRHELEVARVAIDEALAGGVSSAR